MKNVGNSSRGRSQGVPKIFRAPMYRAHCAVIFGIAPLSCCVSVADSRLVWYGIAMGAVVSILLIVLDEAVATHPMLQVVHSL